MQHSWKHSVASAFVFVLSLCSLPALAAVAYDEASSTILAPVNSPQNTNDLIAIGQSFSHLTAGPFEFGSTYNSLLGVIFNSHYIKSINNQWATAWIGEYGPKQYRFNGTIATQLSPDLQAKLTGEYLSQVLPFEFDSGNINQRVGQSVYAAAFRKNFDHFIVQDVNASSYWAKAPSVTLANETFSSNDLLYTNQRNLAGSISQGFNVGSDFSLSPLTTFTTKLYYDAIHYQTQLTDNSTYNTCYPDTDRQWHIPH